MQRLNNVRPASNVSGGSNGSGWVEHNNAWTANSLNWNPAFWRANTETFDGVTGVYSPTLVGVTPGVN
jgi:hypothetical protein